jgi:hypothetical protein
VSTLEDQPSVTMWCRVTTRTCSSGATSISTVAQQRSVPQVERGVGLGQQDLLDVALHHGNRDLEGLVHDLHAASVDLVERGAQRLVPDHERGQRPVERLDVEPATQGESAVGVM